MTGGRADHPPVVGCQAQEDSLEEAGRLGVGVLQADGDATNA